MLNYAPWSPSKADLAGRCGLAYKFKYVDKLEEAPGGSTAGAIGTAIHRVQELHLSGENITTSLETSLSENELTSVDQEQVKSAATAVRSFSTRIQTFTEKHGVKVKLLEQRWAINKDFEPRDFKDPDVVLRGVVDFGMLTNNDQLVIIDHKSGKPKPISSYGVQLDMYAIMGLAHLPQAKSVQCAIHFVRTEEIEWAPPISPSKIKESLQPWLIHFLNKRAADAEEARPRISYQCSWCGYKPVCPAWSSSSNDAEKSETDNKSGA